MPRLLSIFACSDKTMKAVALIISIAMTINNLAAQPSSGSIRPMAVADQFYPADKGQMKQMLEGYFGDCSTICPEEGAVAVIVPHAGYVFSGGVAAKAYSSLPADKVYKHIFLIGPSHHVYFEGASINSRFDYYSTPLDNVKVDTDLCKELVKQDSFLTCRDDAHRSEHCLEVQLPFLQYRLNTMPSIVPIIIGTQNFAVIKALARVLKPYLGGDNLFVISSDFSHYPSYKDARTIDGRTGDAISTGDPVQLLKALQTNFDAGISNLATSACGQCAILTLMLMTQGGSYAYNHLAYLNSGDSPAGGKDEVVGYHAFCVTKKPEAVRTADAPKFSLTDAERQTLLAIARRSIEGAFVRDSIADSWSGSELTPTLQTKTGAFVTLNEGGHLRGCIGHFGEDVPLYKAVASMAVAAAFEDSRFPQVSKAELSFIEIEISVLSPLKRIADIAEFHYGREGIYMAKGGRSGTFLPQVADEVNWTKEEFLGHCAQDKAGIGWDGWKTADLYTYEAIIFKE